MFLGTPRWMWGLIVVLLLVGFAGIGTGQRLIGLLVLGIGLLLFAISPSGPKRERRSRREEASVAPPISTVAPPVLPPAAPAPPRKPLDIEGGDPSQV